MEYICSRVWFHSAQSFPFLYSWFMINNDIWKNKFGEVKVSLFVTNEKCDILIGILTEEPERLVIEVMLGTRTSIMDRNQAGKNAVCPGNVQFPHYWLLLVRNPIALPLSVIVTNLSCFWLMVLCVSFSYSLTVSSNLVFCFILFEFETCLTPGELI